MADTKIKYIDAEKLIAEIKFVRSVYSSPNRVLHGIADGFRQDGRVAMCDDILTKIHSLQQEQSHFADADKMEQPEQTCKTCGFYENNCPFIRGKLIPYPNKVCKDYTYSAMKEQEQPEVDLEEVIERTYHDGSVADTSDMDHVTYENIARHFAEWGAIHFNAR